MKLTRQHYFLDDTEIYFYHKTNKSEGQYEFKGLYDNFYIDFEEIEEYKIKKLSKKIKTNTIGKLAKLAEDKMPNPSDKNNYVGVELEVVSKKSIPELMLLLSRKSLLDKVAIHDDGSIDTTRTYRYTAEICIMDTQENIYKTINQVIKLIKPYCSVNKSCGLHVHLDMRYRNKNECTKKLVATQPLLYSIVSPNRESNSYCRPALDPLDTTKYRGINSTTDFKTVEVRMHHGTLKVYEINNFISLLLKIVDSSFQGEVMVQDFDILNELVIDKATIRYIKTGLKKYNKDRKITEWRFVA